jgi:hypothetical protein
MYCAQCHATARKGGSQVGISALEGLVLLSLRRRPQIGDEILCLGRPELFMSEQHLRDLVAAMGLSWKPGDIARIANSKFGELFLEQAGFRTIRSLDASEYEGAQIIHDLNKPIPDELRNSTHFLYSNGTIEHVFNIAIALHNIVQLLCVGGTALLTAPANGQCGHGFYQLSPEFFYRFFEVNGFEDTRVYLVGRKSPQRWFRAADPRVLKRRVECMTVEPTEVVAIARKARELPAPVTPQQSDYAQLLWHTPQDDLAGKWTPKKSKIASTFYNRILFPCAVGLRYFAGTGMPGLDRNESFEMVDAYGSEL